MSTCQPRRSPADQAPLLVRDTEGIERRLPADAVVQAALHLLEGRMRGSTIVKSPARAMDFIRLKLGTLEHEVFGVIHLDKRCRVIDYVEMFRGTVDWVTVHPREVAKDVVTLNSTAIILVHNHPSGCLQASEVDLNITRSLAVTLQLLGVSVLDHLIVAGSQVVSLAAQGLMAQDPHLPAHTRGASMRAGKVYGQHRSALPGRRS